MIPAARIQAAIDLLDEVILSARDGGPAADTLIARYFKTRRYAGSKDRRAVRDLVYDAIRRSGERPDTGRSAMLGLVQDRAELAEGFDGSPHGPAPIGAEEAAAPKRAVPRWIMPLISDLLDTRERDALLARAPLDIRVNTLKTDVASVAAALSEALPVEGFPDALRLPDGYAVEASQPWQDGWIEVQDAGSQMIASVCAVQPGMTVIDLCAGAGGKTLALAAAMNGEGKLIAADTVRTRLTRLTPRAERAGAGFVETLLLDQGREGATLGTLESKADVVLVDAPCSGTGTWRRNPEARWRLTRVRLDRLAAEQARILDIAAPLVNHGGRLVYAVCALTDREGREQTDAFLTRHPGWRVVPPAPGIGRAWGHGLLLTPHHDGTDGFFLGVLQKS